jgi:hemolysin activation/secretion protein
MFAGARAIATALAMVTVSFAAVAQGVPPGAQIVPPSDQPGRERERFERPPVPLAQPGGPAIAVPGIEAPPGAAQTMLVLRQIRIEGATVYTSAQLSELYADLIGHKITLQAVYDVAGRITAKYGGDGYVLSRAIIPVQELDPKAPWFASRCWKAMSRRSNGRHSSRAIATSSPTTPRASPPSGRSTSVPSSAISCSPATCRG